MAGSSPPNRFIQLRLRGKISAIHVIKNAVIQLFGHGAIIFLRKQVGGKPATVALAWVLPDGYSFIFGLIHFISRLHIEGFVKRCEVHQRPVNAPPGG